MIRRCRYLISPVAAVAALLLASCSRQAPPPALSLPVIPTEKPVPPMGAAEELKLPAVDGQGHYVTPNQGITGPQALWHVRMALNVAALSCRDAGDIMGVEYNRMLRIHAAALAQANSVADDNYGRRYGANANAVRDQVYTVVYNYFALPPAQKAFCQTARAVVMTMNGQTPAALVGHAPEALALLEKPFQDFWAAYAEYLRQLELWRKLHTRVEVLPCPVNDPTCSGDAPPVPPGGVKLPSMPQSGVTPPALPSIPASTAQAGSGQSINRSVAGP